MIDFMLTILLCFIHAIYTVGVLFLILVSTLAFGIGGCYSNINISVNSLLVMES